MVVARKLKKVKSRTLTYILKIFLIIELQTQKGIALYYGVALAIRNKLYISAENIISILYLGISYINNLIWYRMGIEK